MAVEGQISRRAGGWIYLHHAGYAPEPGSVSPDEGAEAGSRLADRPRHGHRVAGDRLRDGPRHRTLPGQGNR